MANDSPRFLFVREDRKPGLWRRGVESLARNLVNRGYYKIGREEMLALVHNAAFTYDFDATKAFFPGPGGTGYIGAIPDKAIYPYQILDSHYQTNPWVNRSVSVIAHSIAALPLKLYSERLVAKKPKREEVLKHDALKLLQRPNSLTTGRSYKMEMASELTMYGEVWQYTDDDTDGKGGKPGTAKELRLFKANHIAPIPDKLKLISEYEYIHNSEPVRIAPHYIASTRLWNPQSSYRGLPPMQVARDSSMLQYYMRKHNKKVFENGTFFGLYMHTEAELNEATADKTREFIKQEFSGPANAHKFPLLYGGFDIKNATTNAKDGDFVSIAKWGREETLTVFGVPPVAVGVLEFANYANTWQQMKMFYELTVMPLCEMLSDMLTYRWLRVFWPQEDNLYFQFDYSGVKFLGEEAESADRIASSRVRDGRMTVNEWRASIDLPPVEWGDDAPPTFSGAFGLSGVPAQVSEKNLWIRKNADYDTRRARWATANKRVEADMPVYSKMMLQHWEDQKQRILSKLRGYSASVSKKKSDIAKALPTAEDLFDGDYEARQLAKVAKPLIGKVVERAGKQRLLDIKSDVTFNVLDTRVETFVSNKTFRLANDVTRFTQKAIREIIIDATFNGLTVDQIASRITQTFDDFEKYRALRVARAESVAAHSGAAIEAYDQGGVEKKGWAAVIDDATRESHVDLDGVEIPLRDDFSNGLSAPGVPGATAGPDVVGELVNCRCTIYAA